MLLTRYLKKIGEDKIKKIINVEVCVACKRQGRSINRTHLGAIVEFHPWF